MNWREFDESMLKPKLAELAEPSSNYGPHVTVYSEMDAREIARMAFLAGVDRGQSMKGDLQ